MILTDFIRRMPKVELHVHLVGAIQPEILLKLAQRHHIQLPVMTVEGLRKWYTFRDFAHFVEVYVKITDCLRTPDDVELIAREFLIGQAAQNIVYTELTHTPNYLDLHGIPFDEQLAAINRARSWAESNLGVSLSLIIDIPREVSQERGMVIAEWVSRVYGNGVVALGLGGPEIDNPPEKFTEAFAYVHQRGVPSVPHAGETVGPESIWGALRSLNPVRIGHGVRCLEDPMLVAELRTRQIPLEVSPTSNVCLHVAPDFEHHPLPRLINDGLYVTINSDDPAMFNTTLTDEYQRITDCFGYDAARLEQFVMDAAKVTLLPAEQKAKLIQRLEAEFNTLRG